MGNNDLTNWVNEFTGGLYKWAYYKTSSAETAEDLVQETFLVAAEKFSSFKGDSSPKTWLFAILNHKIIDYYRKKVKMPVGIESGVISNYFDEHGSWQKEKRPNDWQDEENHLLDNNEFQKVLQKCLDALPEQWNMCVKLKYLTKKNSDDICQKLGIAPTNYWQIVHRAKLQLRNCVENKWFKN